MISIDDIVDIGYADYNIDYLSGYNFYIQTQENLFVLSSKLCSVVVDFITAVRNMK